MELEKQIAVVTGGAQGIGFAVVQQLIDKGVRVASWDIDPNNKENLSVFSEQAIAINCDITDSCLLYTSPSPRDRG